MESVNDHLKRMREERIAREKTRIEKLKQLNLKKYNKEEQLLKPASSVSFLKTDVKRPPLSVPKNNFHVKNTSKRPITAPISNTGNKNPINQGEPSKTSTKIQKFDGKTNLKPFNVSKNVTEKPKPVQNVLKKPLPKIIERPTTIGDFKKPKTTVHFTHQPNLSKNPKGDTNDKAGPSYEKLSRQSFIPKLTPQKSEEPIKAKGLRKSIQPKVTQSTSNLNPRRQTVFERLYQPKNIAQKKNVTDAEKIQSDPKFLMKTQKNAGLVLNKRHTVFETQKTEKPTHMPRKSISAVHFKRLSKNELTNCMHKWSSIGEKLDKVHLKDINEDAEVKEDKIVSAVKSECKRVKFQTPIYNFNTPRPAELQSKLQNWLQKRGKSLDSYHHLQCFGIRHLNQSSFKPVNLEASRFEEFDDEDKENQPVESDSDNDSYEDNMNNKETAISRDKKEELASKDHLTTDISYYNDTNKVLTANIKDTAEFQDRIEHQTEKYYLVSDSCSDVATNKWYSASEKESAESEDKKEQLASNEHLKTDVGCYNDVASKWRRASVMSDCVTDMNETQDSMVTSVGTPHVNELLSGALNDLTELIKEGFDWEQCARWLRAIRERFPSAPHTALYWECRAALEETRGDLPASVHCWEQAIAKGTERSVVEANLDQLLDKFMQLRISPNSGAKRQPDPRLVDVKNVFKSTVIRFAVQQAKIRRESQEPQFTVTPVRRSARLSSRWSEKRAPLQECTSVRQAGVLVPHPLLFVPNDKLCGSP